MSLEEIESKLGSLIQPETITQLKSAVWKERLEGFFCLSVESFCAYLGCKKWMDPSPPFPTPHTKRRGRRWNPGYTYGLSPTFSLIWNNE